MRRMTGAIFIATRPERMIMSAWRGEARKTSAPKRAASLRGAPTTEIISIAQHASPKVSGHGAFARAQFCAFSSVVRPTRDSTYSASWESSISPRSSWRARSWRTRSSPGCLGGKACGSVWSGWRLISTRALRAATRTRRRRPEGDEDDRLDEGEDPERLELHGDRVQEHDLDVEQDEEHRDQVEADPEAEVGRDLGGEPALVGLALDPRRAARPEPAVDRREEEPDADAEDQEHENGQVAPQHGTLGYTNFVTLCNLVRKGAW